MGQQVAQSENVLVGALREIRPKGCVKRLVNSSNRWGAGKGRDHLSLELAPCTQDESCTSGPSWTPFLRVLFILGVHQVFSARDKVTRGK